MTVYLVGAGPGDPTVVTARGLDLIRSCDVLVHDRLVSDQLIEEAPADTLRIGRQPLDQKTINELLVSYGRAGLEVVRLKGGDPFLFGRGGEEALALTQARVQFQVVPGVSSLSAVPAAASIPLTHRGLAAQVTIIAGHQPQQLDYTTLAQAPGTLVVFMGLANLDQIAKGLIAAGKDPNTPTAIIANGTLDDQQTVTAPLTTITAEARWLEPPALILIGQVVALSTTLGVNAHIQPGANPGSRYLSKSKHPSRVDCDPTLLAVTSPRESWLP